MSGGTPYLALFQALDQGGVHYAIAGGLAVVLHGVPRMTFDVDLLLDWAPDNVKRLVVVLRAEGYRPRGAEPIDRLLDPEARASCRRDRGMLAFSLHHPGRPMEEVDLLLGDEALWAEVAETLEVRHLGAVAVPVVGKHALARMKRRAGRPKDLQDADELEAGDGD